MHEKCLPPQRNNTNPLSVAVYLTAEENLLNPSEISLFGLISFYDRELEFVVIKSIILLSSIQNLILLVLDRKKRKAIKDFKEKNKCDGGTVKSLKKGFN